MVILAATCGSLGSYTLNNGFTEGLDQAVGSNGITGVTGHKSATGTAETPSAAYDSSPNRQVIIGFVVKGYEGPPAYPDCASVQAGGHRLGSDLNGDCYVDIQDLMLFAGNWLYSNCLSPDNCQNADFAPIDGSVDFLDFSRLWASVDAVQRPAGPRVHPKLVSIKAATINDPPSPETAFRRAINHLFLGVP